MKSNYLNFHLFYYIIGIRKYYILQIKIFLEKCFVSAARSTNKFHPLKNLTLSPLSNFNF